jgi:hypothetical protein
VKFADAAIARCRLQEVDKRELSDLLIDYMRKMHQASMGTQVRHKPARRGKSTTIMKLTEAAADFQNDRSHRANWRADSVVHTATPAPFSRSPPQVARTCVKLRRSRIALGQYQYALPCALKVRGHRAESLAFPAVDAAMILEAVCAGR